MQIYNGKRGNYQDIPMSRECSSLLDNVINTDNKLKKALSKEPELLKLYSENNEALAALHHKELSDYYLEGFRLGALVGIDIMTPPDN